MPPGLFAAYTAAIQKDSGPAYLPASTGNGGYQAENPAHTFQATFNREGVGVNDWSMRLSGYIFSGQPASPVVETSPVLNDKRIEYRYGNGLTEWYVNTTMGLEQGFTLENPLSQNRAGINQNNQLELNLALQGTTALQDSASRIILSKGQQYGGLKAWDARHQPLEAKLATTGDSIKLTVGLTGAVYPITIDPFLQQQKLLDNGLDTDDRFGSSVTFSSDGNTAFVGARGWVSVTGAVYVFTLDNGTWTETQKITQTTPGPTDNFGYSLALSKDDSTLMVGATTSNNVEGSAYVYILSSGVWTLQQILTASDATTNSNFGFALALTDDGNLAFISDPRKNDTGGGVYIFSRSGGTWTEQNTLVPTDSGSYFGFALALSGDGETAFITELTPGRGYNAVFVYTHDCNYLWDQSQTLAPSGVTNDISFGGSLDLNDDANVAIIGATGGNDGKGAAYIYTESGGTWTEQQTLTGSDSASSDNFGNSVTLSGDGKTALVGATGKNSTSGAVYAFTESGGTWSQLQKFVSSDIATGDLFGTSTALTGDGNRALVGSQGKNSNTGAAYIFDLGTLNPTVNLVSSANPTFTGQNLTFTTTISGTLDMPTGNVTFLVDSVPADTKTLDGNGQASYSTSSLAAGTHTIVASYAGDNLYNTKDSNELSQLVLVPTDQFAVSGYPSNTIVGEGHSFTVKALDAGGNLNATYAGTVHFTSSDPDAVLPPDAALTNGVGTFYATFKTVGIQSLTATDTLSSTITGTQFGIAVRPVPAPEAKAKLVGRLKVTPDRVVSPDPDNLIRYSFTVGNTGPGRSGATTLTLPVDPQLVLGYTEFSNPATWVSSLSTSQVAVTLPALDTHQSLSGALVFRPNPAPQPSPGSRVTSRYSLKWNNLDGSTEQTLSNGISFNFGEPGVNKDATQGAVQLFKADPPNGTKVTYHGDFWIPGELVSAWLTKPDGTSVPLSSGRADEQGRFDITVQTEGLAAGTYVVAAYGQLSQEYGSGVLEVSSTGIQVKLNLNLQIKALGGNTSPDNHKNC